MGYQPVRLEKPAQPTEFFNEWPKIVLFSKAREVDKRFSFARSAQRAELHAKWNGQSADGKEKVILSDLISQMCQSSSWNLCLYRSPHQEGRGDLQLAVNTACDINVTLYFSVQFLTGDDKHPPGKPPSGAGTLVAKSCKHLAAVLIFRLWWFCFCGRKRTVKSHLTEWAAVCYLSVELSVYDSPPGTACIQPESYTVCWSLSTEVHFNVSLVLNCDLMASFQGSTEMTVFKQW